MALEVIRTIVDTEGKAEELVKKATADAKEQIKTDEKLNEEYYEKKVAEANQKASEILLEFDALAAAEQQALKADMDSKTLELKNKAEKNLDEAVKFVLGRLE